MHWLDRSRLPKRLDIAITFPPCAGDRRRRSMRADPLTQLVNAFFRGIGYGLARLFMREIR